MKRKGDSKRRSVLIGCSMQVGIWVKRVRDFIFFLLSMLLSLQGEQGFVPFDLPPPLAVHPSIDDRHSLCSLTWLPHSKEAFQLLQGSTVWSCPVWLQTKHQRDSGTTSDHQTGLHVILTSCTKGEEDGLRHFAFCVKLLTFYHDAPLVCIFNVQTFGLIFLCVSESVFFLILEPPSCPCGECIAQTSLRQSPCLCYWCCVVCIYNVVVLQSDEDWPPDSYLQELPTALAPQLCSPMAIKSLTMGKLFN